MEMVPQSFSILVSTKSQTSCSLCNWRENGERAPERLGDMGETRGLETRKSSTHVH